MRRFDIEHQAAVVAATHDAETHFNNRSRLLPDGRVTFSQVFTVVILFVVGIQGLKFIAPWYDFQRLKGSMQESVNQSALLPDGDIIGAVLSRAKELRVPLASQDIHAERSRQGGVCLWAEYDVTLSFPLGLTYTQTFRPEVRSGRL